MTGRERRLLRMLCMTSSGGGGGDKPWDEMTWDEVIAATKNGKYKDFEIGAMKELDLGTEGIVHMQIVGIDADELADGSGYAPLTFISHELLNTYHRMNPTETPSTAPYDEGTGAIGGWEKCEMRTYLKETIKPLIPEIVRNAIVNVKKFSNIINTSGTKVMNSVTTDDIWVPSAKEVFGGINDETTGAEYTDAFYDDADRIKLWNGAARWWYTRTAHDVGYFCTVINDGTKSNMNSGRPGWYPLGFCL